MNGLALPVTNANEPTEADAIILNMQGSFKKFLPLFKNSINLDEVYEVTSSNEVYRVRFSVKGDNYLMDYMIVGRYEGTTYSSIISSSDIELYRVKIMFKDYVPGNVSVSKYQKDVIATVSEKTNWSGNTDLTEEMSAEQKQECESVIEKLYKANVEDNHKFGF